MAKQTMTITAPMENGEQAIFTVVPAGTMTKFLEDIEWVASPECVVELASQGCWEIV